MEAITMGPGDVAVVDLDRCIGCGLCVTTCETEALSLHTKAGEERCEPPATAQEYMMQLAQERGKILIPLAFTKTGL
jgi:ferredoxin